jgi:hypothetical protein
VLFGIDPGFNPDPTAIVVMYITNGKWYQHARLNWYGVEYPDQAKLIAYLDQKFNPSSIGIDEGGPGKPVVQFLLADDKYKERNFNEKIVPINFASSITFGVDDEGNDLKTRAKEFAVRNLQQLTNTKKIVFSRLDEELITELERTTFTKSVNGNVTFRTFTEKGGARGSDHNMSAYLAGFTGWYLRFEGFFQHEKPVKLIRSRWMFK